MDRYEQPNLVLTVAKLAVCAAATSSLMWLLMGYADNVREKRLHSASSSSELAWNTVKDARAPETR
jgi:hypothetical protein